MEPKNLNRSNSEFPGMNELQKRNEIVEKKKKIFR